MDNSSPTNIEDRIELAKQAFHEQLSVLLAATSTDADASVISRAISDVHTQATKFFNLVDRSIAEQGLNPSGSNENTLHAKLDSAVNTCNTILKYWSMLGRLRDKYHIRIPVPSERAYGSMQTFLKTYDPEKAQELLAEYRAEGLPTYGFEHTRKFNDMTKKQQITYGIIAGTVFLAALLVIILVVKCPTEAQDRIFTTISALAAAAFSMAITGFLNINYRQMISAGGALAVFVIVFLLRPAQLSTFSSCVTNLSGTVYFGEKPQSNVELRLLKQNQVTSTDGFGNFNVPFDYATVDKVMDIQLISADLRIDTIIRFEKSVLRTSLDIPITQHCAACVQKDSLDNVVRRAQHCGGSREFISEYIEGYTAAAKEQGLAVDCQTTQRIKK